MALGMSALRSPGANSQRNTSAAGIACPKCSGDQQLQKAAGLTWFQGMHLCNTVRFFPTLNGQTARGTKGKRLQQELWTQKRRQWSNLKRLKVLGWALQAHAVLARPVQHFSLPWWMCVCLRETLGKKGVWHYCLLEALSARSCRWRKTKITGCQHRIFFS